jgi:hypothetical protein
VQPEDGIKGRTCGMPKRKKPEAEFHRLKGWLPRYRTANLDRCLPSHRKLSVAAGRRFEIGFRCRLYVISPLPRRLRRFLLRENSTFEVLLFLLDHADVVIERVLRKLMQDAPDAKNLQGEISRHNLNFGQI